MLPHQKLTYLPFLILNTVEDIAKEFSLGNVVEQPENNNSGNESFRLTTDKGLFQVKSYSKSAEDPNHFATLIQREIAYTRYLETNGFIVQHHLSFQPLLFQGKLTTVTTFLEGEQLTSAVQTPETISLVGTLLGNLHLASSKHGNAGAFSEQRNSFRDRVEQNLTTIEQLLELPAKEFLPLLDLYQDLRIKRQESDLIIPRGLTHGELTYGHLLKQKDGRIGILDFEGLKFTPHIFDFGQTLITMAIVGETVHHNLISAFFESYQKVRPLSKNEMELIPNELIYNYLHKLEWRMSAMLNNPGYIEIVKSSILNAKTFMEQVKELTFA